MYQVGQRRQILMTIVATWLLQMPLIVTGDPEEVQVETNLGTIVGKCESVRFNGTDYNIDAFYGIPYAKAPVGELRFAKPVQKQPFATPYIAHTPPPFCLQNPAYLDFFGISISLDQQSEDCLRLNIFTPPNTITDGSKRAVLFWIHGGFYEVETQNWYLAKLLTATQDMIYVTTNYRLTVLGFLSTGNDDLPGNNGLWDQRMALEWVYENIEAFGGDKDRISIAGESAGSMAVIHHALYKYPADQSKLFRGVIAQSGSANSEFTIDNEPMIKFQTIASKTNCSSGSHEDTISCLQSLPAGDLMAQLTIDLAFPPVVDGEFIKMHPRDVFLNQNNAANDILEIYRQYNIIFGLNSDEGALYLPSLDDLVASSGYTVNAFENEIIPFVMQTTKKEDTPLLRSAVILQYLDLSQPDNTAMIRQASVDLFSDTLFNADVIQSAMSHARSNSNGHTFLYIFDHRSILSYPGIKGASHAEEVIFALGFPLDQLKFFYNIVLDDPADVFTENDLDLALDMMEYWANFVKTGNPNLGDYGQGTLTQWPYYDLASQSYIRFKGGLDTFPVESRYIANRIQFWLDFIPKYGKGCDSDDSDDSDDSSSSSDSD